MILKSHLLARFGNLTHAFGTRVGGVSGGPFATMNLGGAVGDDAEKVAANRSRIQALAGIGPGAEWIEMEQVHGVRVVNDPGTDRERADGAITARSGRILTIRTADCAPILIAVSDGVRASAVAAVHAGWRGATAGIVAEAIRQLEALGAARERISIAIGPTIGPDAFEVGDEVIEAARASLGGAPPPVKWAPGAQPRLDLRGLLAAQIDQLGLGREQVEMVGGCTAEQPSLYFSHRRDRGRTGRQVSLIALGAG
jgi:YfiH family protein